MTRDSNGVPVSIVDMDVPVTAIDDILEDYECNESKSFTRTESTDRKGRNNHLLIKAQYI